MLHLIHWEPTNVLKKRHPKNSLADLQSCTTWISSMLKQTGWIKPSNHHHHHPQHVPNLQPRSSLTSNSCHLKRFRKHTPRWLKSLHDIFRTSKPSIVENFTVQKTSAMFGRSFMTFQDSLQCGSYLSLRVKWMLNPLENPKRSESVSRFMQAQVVGKWSFGSRIYPLVGVSSTVY